MLSSDLGLVLLTEVWATPGPASLPPKLPQLWELRAPHEGRIHSFALLLIPRGQKPLCTLIHCGPTGGTAWMQLLPFGAH